MNTDVAKIGETTFKKAFENLCERWETEKEKQKDFQKEFWKKVDLTDNFSLVPNNKSLMDIKRKDLANSFINETIDLPSKKIKGKRIGSSGSSGLQQLLIRVGIS